MSNLARLAVVMICGFALLAIASGHLDVGLILFASFFGLIASIPPFSAYCIVVWLVAYGVRDARALRIWSVACGAVAWAVMAMLFETSVVASASGALIGGVFGAVAYLPADWRRPTPSRSTSDSAFG